MTSVPANLKTGSCRIQQVMKQLSRTRSVWTTHLNLVRVTLYIHIYIHKSVSMYTYIYIYLSLYICIYKYICICICICIYIYIYLFIYLFIYTWVASNNGCFFSRSRLGCSGLEGRALPPLLKSSYRKPKLQLKRI